jgi:hypothetical protein
MAVEVHVEKQEWCSREPDPEDSWDAGDYDGYVDSVEAFWVDRPADPIQWHGSTFEADGAVPGDRVYVVVADYASGSTFGTTAGSHEVLNVFKSGAAALGLAQAAEQFTGAERAPGSLATWEFEHDGQKYYASWLGYFENLRDVRVWDCFLRPAEETA